MAVLVTGGAGYVGSQMCLRLAERGVEIVVIDDLSAGRREAVHEFEFVEGRVGDRRLLDDLLESHDISAVMHFAASIEVAESIANPSKYYYNNVVETQSMLDCMVDHGIGRLVFSSSAAVFGVPRYSPIDSKHPVQPISPYGSSKAVVESMLEDYGRAYGLRSMSLRYFNAAGGDPQRRTGECHEPETHLIPLVLQVASGRREFVGIFGEDYETRDGTCIRDYVHVTDLCEAHLLALNALDLVERSERINLGSACGSSVREVIEAAEEVTSREIAFRGESRRGGDPPSLVCDSTDAARLLGWTPVRSDLRSIIRDAWKWETQHFCVGAEEAAPPRRRD